MDRSEAMGRAPVGRLLMQFAVPTTASMLVIALYSLVDRVFIGRGAGVDGIAAATAAFPFMIIGLAVGLLFSVGARSVASVALGAGGPDEAKAAISGAVGASFLATVAAGLAVWIFADPLLAMFGAGARIAGDAKTFLGWMLLGLPFQSAAMTVSSSLQVQGRPRSAFVVNLAGCALNVGLDWLFIFGFGWGLVGAASATAASQLFSLALSFAVVQGRSSELKVDFSRILPKPALLGRIAAIGAPVFLANIVSTAILLVANRAIVPYGGDMALAVIGVVNTIGMVVSYPLYGITNGAQPLFGYNYGAGEWKRLGRLSVLVAAWTLGLAALAEFAAVFRPEALIGLFGSDAALIAMGGPRPARLHAGVRRVPAVAASLRLLPVDEQARAGRRAHAGEERDDDRRHARPAPAIRPGRRIPRGAGRRYRLRGHRRGPRRQDGRRDTRREACSGLGGARRRYGGGVRAATCMTGAPPLTSGRGPSIKDACSAI